MPHHHTWLSKPTRQPTKSPPSTAIVGPSDWRCSRCAKLLGVRGRGKLHICVHGHDYTVSFPVEAVCRGCGCFNRTDIDQAR